MKKTKKSDTFDTYYPQFRKLYEDAVLDGHNPLEIFGIMLGIIAQEFIASGDLEGFEDLLTMVMEHNSIKKLKNHKGQTLH